MTAEARVTSVPSAPADMDARTRRLLEGPLPRTLLVGDVVVRGPDPGEDDVPF